MAQSIPATILVMSIIVDATTLRAADDFAGNYKVEVNTNAVGCADFKISDVASPAKDRIEMTVRITEIPGKDRRPLFPCVCNHAFYNFSVYPKDQYSAPESVRMTGRRFFIRNFSVGHSLMKGKTSTLERVQFPFFRRANGMPFSHYYIVFGCRSGG